VIAHMSSGTAGGPAQRIVFINTSDGTMSAVTGGALGLDWIDDSTLVIGRLDDSGTPQLWRLSYPDGTLRRVTNDVNTYAGISIGADRNTLVTARSEEHGLLWIGDGTAKEGTETIQPSLANSAQNILTWHGDRLFFVTRRTIFALLPDGGQPEEFLKSAVSPVFTTDGKTMVYIGAVGGLWKADADGRDPVQLVPGVTFWPLITIDDRNVIYESFAGGFLQMWMIPLTGGTPTLVNPTQAAHPVLSPDGKSLAFGSQEQNQWFISVCGLPDCKELRHVRSMDVRLFIQKWTPDGRAIAYATVSPGANIMIHPLDGSPERQLTNFNDARTIADFAWSQDGKHFAVARVSTSQDIVLFTGIKPLP